MADIWFFVSSLFFTWYFVIPSALVLTCLVHYDSRFWAGLMAVGLSVSLYSLTAPSLITLLIVVASFIPIGFVWSFFRWGKHCKHLSELTDRPVRSSFDPASNVSLIAYWVVFWPFSILESILGDFLDLIKDIIVIHLASKYRKISDKYTTDSTN